MLRVQLADTIQQSAWQRFSAPQPYAAAPDSRESCPRLRDNLREEAVLAAEFTFTVLKQVCADGRTQRTGYAQDKHNPARIRAFFQDPRTGHLFECRAWHSAFLSHVME